MAWKISILLWFFAINCTFAQFGARQEDVPDENFEIFLKNSMSEFPSWLNETHLPYLVTPGQLFPFQFRGNRFNLTGVLLNQNVTLNSDRADTTITNASLANFTFSVKSSLRVVLTAEQDTTVSYLNDSGIPKVVFFSGGLYSHLDNSFELRVTGFQVDSEGYIDLSSANVEISQNVSFEYFDWEDDDIVDDYLIRSTMTCALNVERDKMTLFPVSSFALDYLQKILAETPIDQMKNIIEKKEKLKSIEKEQDPDAKLSEIIDYAMRRFWDWILANNLDPTPLISEQFVFKIEGHGANITGRFWNHQTRGHGYSEGFYSNEVSVADQYFEVSFQNKKLTVEGEYLVAGTFSNGVSFQSVGEFWAPTWRTGDSGTRVYVNGFNISEDGYVDLSTATVNFEQFIAFDEFVLSALNNDIEDAEVREEVWKAMYCAYEKQVEFYKAFPIGSYAVQYLQGIFNENPI